MKNPWFWFVANEQCNFCMSWIKFCVGDVGGKKIETNDVVQMIMGKCR